MNKLYFLILAILALFCVETVVSQNISDILKPNMGEKIGECSICGMDVFEKMLTRVEIVLPDTTVYACALGCASAIMEKHPPKKYRAFVYDCESGKPIVAQDAYFVFGSRLTPVRAMLPSLAFLLEKDAERFQKIYGGTILTGTESIETAAKIRQERMREKEKKQ